MNNCFEHRYSNYVMGYAVVPPRPAIVLNVIDSFPPIQVENKKGDVSHLIKLYRDKGYPLGKSRRGIKKYLKKRLLNALDCKSYNEFVRKYKCKESK